nr:hypothetical protein JVH1_6804 [Rhodococcus sp. JVH1]
MPADPGSIHADSDKALPKLTTGDVAVDPHIITAAARTGTDVELRIHTYIAPFDVAAEQWFPAAAGFAVTVIAYTVDAATGRPRHLPSAEPSEWARAIFSTVDNVHGYFLGAVDPDTGGHRPGQLATASTSTPTGRRFPCLSRWSPARTTCYLPSTAELRSPFPRRLDPAGRPGAAPLSAGAASTGVRSARPAKGATLKSRRCCSLMWILHPSRSGPLPQTVSRRGLGRRERRPGAESSRLFHPGRLQHMDIVVPQAHCHF